MLVVLTGLPCTGKSEIAESIAKALPATVLSADPIDAALIHAGVQDRPDIVGYQVMKTLAREQLALDTSVVIDAVNPYQWVRDEYAEIAAAAAAPFVVIATICTDQEMHRTRVEKREKPIDWDGVKRQISYYEPPADEVLLLDAVRPLDENLTAALEFLTARR